MGEGEGRRKVGGDRGEKGEGKRGEEGEGKRGEDSARGSWRLAVGVLTFCYCSFHE